MAGGGFLEGQASYQMNQINAAMCLLLYSPFLIRHARVFLSSQKRQVLKVQQKRVPRYITSMDTPYLRQLVPELKRSGVTGGCKPPCPGRESLGPGQG